MKFEEILSTSRSRFLAATDFRQRIRAKAGPAIARKYLGKFLWPTSIRHMRYVRPEAGFKPLAHGGWEVFLRGKNACRFVSTPLSELRQSTARPSVIIATGPSARGYDWPGLADGRRLIWAVNGAPTLLAEHGLRSDFLVVSDPRFACDGADHIALAVDQGATLLLTHEAAAGFAVTRPEVLAKARFHLFEKTNRWYGLPVLGPAELVAANEESGRPFFLPDPPVAGVGWSHDPLVGVFAGKTVTFAALQLAVWAGSQTIELVGLDLGGAGHAYHEDRPAVSQLEKDYRKFILPSFECMAAALKGASPRIVNLSPTCPLPRELFDREEPLS